MVPLFLNLNICHTFSSIFIVDFEQVNVCRVIIAILFFDYFFCYGAAFANSDSICYPINWERIATG